ncbi:MAG: hypothetical protein ACR2LJ_12195, partial [Acidimicrobiales bacterium]
MRGRPRDALGPVDCGVGRIPAHLGGAETGDLGLDATGDGLLAGDGGGGGVGPVMRPGHPQQGNGLGIGQGAAHRL